MNNKITREQAELFVDMINNKWGSIGLPSSLCATVSAKVEYTDSTVQLNIAQQWMNKDDIKSLRRILKAIEETLL